MQLYLDQGYAYLAMDVPGSGVSGGTWDPVSRQESEGVRVRDVGPDYVDLGHGHVGLEKGKSESSGS